MIRDLAPVLRALARPRCGIVTREELLVRGIAARSIARAVADGLLVALFPGVYLVAGVPDLWVSTAAAAVLYVERQARRKWRGDRPRPLAALSGTGAASLHGLQVERPTTPYVVTWPLSRSTLVLTRPREALTRPDVVDVGGLPTTSVAWTLVEVMAGIPGALGRNLVSDALRERRVTLAELLDVAERSQLVDPGRLHDALGGPASWARARSDVERILAAAVVELGHLPEPRVNATVSVQGHHYELDLSWGDVRFNTEVDGPRHLEAHQRARDRGRDAVLRRAGWTILRIPADRVRDDLQGATDLVIDAYRGHVGRRERLAVAG